MLASSIEPDRRAAMRHRVDYPVLAERHGGDDLQLRIVNVSSRGFMANIDAPIAMGARLTMTLPVVGRIEAYLLWTDGRRAGFQFERILRLGDFTRMFVEMQPKRRFRDQD